jgi:hypothetical protein
MMLPGSGTTGATPISHRAAPRTTSELSPEGIDAVGVAVIGVGDGGTTLLRLLADDPHAEVRWIWDLDHDRLTEYRWRYPAVRVTTRLGRLLADPRLEAVIIATPVYTHYELAARALAAGKHAFVEKPLAPPSELVDDLVAMAVDGGRILMCGHAYVELPDFIRSVRSVRAKQGMGFQTKLDRSVIRGVREADASLRPGGHKVRLVERGGDTTNQRPVPRDFAIV